MARAGVGLLTHFDIDHLLGGPVAGARARQRMTQEGLLPRLRWERVGRVRVGFLSELLLLGLLARSAASREDRRVLALAAELNDDLVHDGSFDAIVEAALDALSLAHDAGPLTLLVTDVAERSPDALSDWHAELDEHERSLAVHGAFFYGWRGKARGWRDDLMTVDIGYRTVQAPYLVLRGEIDDVAVRNVELLGRSRQFVMPLLFTTHAATPAPTAPPREDPAERLAHTPFAAAVAEVLADPEARRMPPRFVGDAERASRASPAPATEVLVDRLAEDRHEPEIRRAPFRPAGRSD